MSLSSHSTDVFGPVSYQSEPLDPSTSLFIFVPEMETVWFCRRVHIAHAGIYCPVDIVFEFGTFGILYISRQEVGGGGPADWEISSLTLWRPLMAMECSDVVYETKKFMTFFFIRPKTKFLGG